MDGPPQFRSAIIEAAGLRQVFSAGRSPLGRSQPGTDGSNPSPSSGESSANPTIGRILANDYAVTVVLSPLTGLLQREAPKVTVEILPLEHNFVERLAGDEYDVATTLEKSPTVIVGCAPESQVRS